LEEIWKKFRLIDSLYILCLYKYNYLYAM
jgi:hypothetical protein